MKDIEQGNDTVILRFQKSLQNVGKMLVDQCSLGGRDYPFDARSVIQVARCQ